jgi:hypothetical protein
MTSKKSSRTSGILAIANKPSTYWEVRKHSSTDEDAAHSGEHARRVLQDRGLPMTTPVDPVYCRWLLPRTQDAAS